MIDSNQNSTVLIITNPDIRIGIQVSLSQYVNDLEIEGYTVITDNFNGGSPRDMKTHILNQYNSVSSSKPLAGCILIGDLPIPKVRSENNYPLDSFYMDLNGDWRTDNSGEVLDIPDRISLQIWIGRLTATAISGNEVELVNDYFKKNHEYRTCQMNVMNRAIVYVDDDWVPKGDYGLPSAYEDFALEINKGTTAADDYKNKIKENYEFMHVAVHSNAQSHRFKLNHVWEKKWVTNEDILSIKPQPIFYILDACKAVLYTESNYIGGCYIFSKGRGLAVIGETCNANAMDESSEFYSHFGQGYSIGESFINWFNNRITPNYNKDRIILGDPTLKKQSEYISKEPVAPPPPSGLKIVS